MKKIALVALLALGGCGYTAVDNELIGQVKKVTHQTPLVCPDYKAVDISLGVIRGGVGSVSTEDLWLRVLNESDLSLLKAASESGRIVKARYDVRRVVVCYPHHNLTRVVYAD